MGNRAWHYWVTALFLAAALWAGGSARAEEKAKPRTFNSAVAFDVYAVVGEEDQLIGSTPSERPLTIPPCQWWYVEPRPLAHVGRVPHAPRRQVERGAAGGYTPGTQGVHS
jgi:hypothetical protein